MVLRVTRWDSKTKTYINMPFTTRQNLTSAAVEKTDRNPAGNLKTLKPREKSARTVFRSDSNRILVVHHRGSVMTLGCNN